jgi:hypoxanthine phosphoribosyltransferase
MPERPDVEKITGGRPLTGVLFDEETIQRRVAELGDEIGEYYPSGDLLLVGLLKGSFMFLSDLVRSVPRPLQLDFLVAASYGKATKSSGHVRLLYDPATDVAGKHVLLVDDIVDSGRTLNRLVRLFEARDPLSLDVCAFLHKRVVEVPVLEPRFVGFDAPNAFLVGYGLDFAEDFRHLPFIAALKE